MRLAIFGLTVTSSWGNGHATIWRALCSALASRGHRITFFERDVPYYASHRDLKNSDSYEVVLYSHWSDIEPRARQVDLHRWPHHVRDHDVVHLRPRSARRRKL